MSRRAVWSRTLIALCLAGGALAFLADAVSRLVPPDDPAFVIDVVVAGIGALALLFAFATLARHFRGLADAEDAGAAHADPAALDPARAIIADAPKAGSGALTAALRCLDRPAVMIGERGGILQMNPAAVAFLDPLGLPRWANIHDLIEPEDLRLALIKARREGRPVDALLRDRQGAEITVRVADLGFQAGAIVVFDGDGAGVGDGRASVKPSRPGGRWGIAMDAATPLATAPMVALRVERADGHLVGVSTVKFTGGRVFTTISADFPIRSAGPTPPDPDAEPPTGRPLAEVWPALSDALRGAVVVAHRAAEAWAALTSARAAAGFPPIEPPPMIDLGRMAARWEPDWAGMDVEALADRLAITEPEPTRRLARVAAALARGPDGGGVGTFGELAGELAESPVEP